MPETPVLSERDFERLEAAVKKFDAARDQLAQAQQVVVLEFNMLNEKLKTVGYWRELLREARDTVRASTVEEDISPDRRAYRQGLEKRMTDALGIKG